MVVAEPKICMFPYGRLIWCSAPFECITDYVKLVYMEKLGMIYLGLSFFALDVIVVVEDDPL